MKGKGVACGIGWLSRREQSRGEARGGEESMGSAVMSNMYVYPSICVVIATHTLSLSRDSSLTERWIDVHASKICHFVAWEVFAADSE